MNAQELFDAFRAVDPAWLKEADQLADRAAERISCTDSTDSPENEIGQIFTKYQEESAKAASRRGEDPVTAAKNDDSAELSGTLAGAAAVHPELTAAETGKSSRIFRMLGGIAAAVALVSIGAIGVSVLGGRNSDLSAPPAALYASQQQSSADPNRPADGSEDSDSSYTRDGNTAFTVYYQDLKLIDKQPVMSDGGTAMFMSFFKTPDIYQPAGTPVELTLMPDTDRTLLPGYEYRVIVEQDDAVLDISDAESGESVKTFTFISSEDPDANTYTISFTPDYTRDGAVIKIFLISITPSGQHFGTNSCMLKLHTAEPGASCTYSLQSPSNKVTFYDLN